MSSLLMAIMPLMKAVSSVKHWTKFVVKKKNMRAGKRMRASPRRVPFGVGCQKAKMKPMPMAMLRMLSQFS